MVSIWFVLLFCLSSYFFFRVLIPVCGRRHDWPDSPFPLCSLTPPLVFSSPPFILSCLCAHHCISVGLSPTTTFCSFSVSGDFSRCSCFLSLVFEFLTILWKERKQLVSLCHSLIEKVQCHSELHTFGFDFGSREKDPLYPQPSLTKTCNWGNSDPRPLTHSPHLCFRSPLLRTTQLYYWLGHHITISWSSFCVQNCLMSAIPTSV